MLQKVHCTINCRKINSTLIMDGHLNLVPLYRVRETVTTLRTILLCVIHPGLKNYI